MVFLNNNEDITNNDNGLNGINENHNNDNEDRLVIPVPLVHNDNHPNMNNINPNPNQNLIQDLDGWLESNGLRSMDDVVGGESNLTSGSTIQEEECRRIQEESRYAQAIHRQAFQQELLREQKEREHKQQVIRSLRDKTIDIRTRHDEMIYHIPIAKMAQVCDTIYTMVQNKSLWDDDGELSNNDHDDDDDHSKIHNSSPTTSTTNSFLQLSLEAYSKPTVQAFVNLCMSYHNDDDDTSKSSSPPSPSSSSVLPLLHQMTDDAIILDCCRIGHYLLANPIVDAIIHELLIPNIDTHNCFTLYRLAEELNLTNSTLLQRTLSHMIQTIGEYSRGQTNDDNNDDTNDKNKNSNEDDDDEWNNDRYRQELNERLRIMKRALESSVHEGGGSGSPQLYFSSVEEYLSIFAERVQYYRERLQDAKECQNLLLVQPFSSSLTIRGRVMPSSYRDAELKLQKQEQRVRTLEIAYAEQKALFRNSSNSDKNTDA